jgi:hypothetical protein
MTPENLTNDDRRPLRATLQKSRGVLLQLPPTGCVRNTSIGPEHSIPCIRLRKGGIEESGTKLMV